MLKKRGKGLLPRHRGNPDPHEKVSLSLTGITYRKFKQSSWDRLSGEEFKILPHKSSEEKQKEMRKEFAKAIREEQVKILKR